jgi:hypothetical protein
LTPAAGVDCAGLERWKDCAGAGAVCVRAGALSVRAPRLPTLEPLPARASASAGANARTSAAVTAKKRPAVRLFCEFIEYLPVKRRRIERAQA